MNTLPSAMGTEGNAGAVAFGGPQAAPAHFQVGAVGFGPSWTMEDSMAASIVRLQREVEERDARIAVLEEQARILVAERDEARVQYQTTHLLAEALAKTQVELKAERDDAREALRLAPQRARVQAGAYKLEDRRDNSRWSIFNEGRAQALEKFAEELEGR